MTPSNQESVSSIESAEEEIIAGVVFEKIKKGNGQIKYQSSSKDRKIITLSADSEKPVEGVPYRVRVIEDIPDPKNPENPLSGKIIAELIVTEEEQQNEQGNHDSSVLEKADELVNKVAKTRPIGSAQEVAELTKELESLYAQVGTPPEARDTFEKPKEQEKAYLPKWYEGQKIKIKGNINRWNVDEEFYAAEEIVISFIGGNGHIIIKALPGGYELTVDQADLEQKFEPVKETTAWYVGQKVKYNQSKPYASNSTGLVIVPGDEFLIEAVVDEDKNSYINAVFDTPENKAKGYAKGITFDTEMFERFFESVENKEINEENFSSEQEATENFLNNFVTNNSDLTEAGKGALVYKTTRLRERGPWSVLEKTHVKSVKQKGNTIIIHHGKSGGYSKIEIQS